MLISRPVDDFIKLLNHKKDIVSGMYLMDGGKQFTTVIDWNEEYYKKNGKFHFQKSPLQMGKISNGILTLVTDITKMVKLLS